MVFDQNGQNCFRFQLFSPFTALALAPVEAHYSVAKVRYKVHTQELPLPSLEKHFFQSQDENENFSYSISHIETRREFMTLNLRLRDETEKKCHSISGIETRSRFIIFNLRL